MFIEKSALNFFFFHLTIVISTYLHFAILHIHIGSCRVARFLVNGISAGVFKASGKRLYRGEQG